MKIAIKVTTKNPSKNIRVIFRVFSVIFFWLKAFEPSFSWEPLKKCEQMRVQMCTKCVNVFFPTMIFHAIYEMIQACPSTFDKNLRWGLLPFNEFFLFSFFGGNGNSPFQIKKRFEKLVKSQQIRGRFLLKVEICTCLKMIMKVSMSIPPEKKEIFLRHEKKRKKSPW